MGERAGFEAMYASAGWDPDDSPELVKLGAIDVPSRFKLAIIEYQGPDGEVASTVVLFLEVRDSAVELRQVLADPAEVPAALDQVRKERSLDDWKRLALMSLAADRVEAELGIPGYDFHAVGNAIRRAHDTPIARRRNRITDAHLQQVAQVYRDAWRAGEPPTKAVAAHFDAGDSTAARWVSMARDAGHLGAPAPGARGGEADG